MRWITGRALVMTILVVAAWALAVLFMITASMIFTYFMPAFFPG